MSQCCPKESYELLVKSYEIWRNSMKFLEYEEEGKNEENSDNDDDWIDIEENENNNMEEDHIEENNDIEEIIGKKRKTRYSELIEKDNNNNDNDFLKNVSEEIYDFLPPQQFRFNTAKMFIEHSDYFHAIEIIESLLLEDNTIPEFWLLLAESIIETKRKKSIVNNNENQNEKQKEKIEEEKIEEEEEYDWEQILEILEKAKELFEKRHIEFPIEIENIETQNIMKRLEMEIEIVKKKIIEGTASTSTSTF